MPKGVTGEVYSQVASKFLLQRDYSRALFAADIAYFLGAASVALVWCKYHYDKIIAGDTEGERVSFFLTAYKLSEYFKVHGYREYEELASAMWAAAHNFHGTITKSVMTHVQNLQAAAKKYAGVEVTLEEGLQLITTMTKPAESIFPPLNPAPDEITESTHLLQDVTSNNYGGSALVGQRQVEAPVKQQKSFFSKLCSCFGTDEVETSNTEAIITPQPVNTTQTTIAKQPATSLQAPYKPITTPTVKPLKANELVFTGQHTTWGKAMQYYDSEGAPRCMIYDQDYTSQYKIGVRTAQSQYTTTVTKYRSIKLPDKIMQPVESTEFSFVLSKPNGIKIDEKDVAYLIVKYDESGKLVKLSVPGNVTIPGFNDSLPLLTMHKGALYTVPITAGTFKFLEGKVLENHGVVELGQTPGGIAEYIL